MGKGNQTCPKNLMDVHSNVAIIFDEPTQLDKTILGNGSDKGDFMSMWSGVPFLDKPFVESPIKIFNPELSVVVAGTAKGR